MFISCFRPAQVHYWRSGLLFIGILLMSQPAWAQAEVPVQQIITNKVEYPSQNGSADYFRVMEMSGIEEEKQPILNTENSFGTPTVITVVTQLNVTYTAGQFITVLVLFSENITVTGAPTLLLDIGGNSRQATYSSVIGEVYIEFNYLVQASDNDADGITATSLNLNGGTIQLDDGSNADLAFNAVTFSSAKVDNIRPSVTSVAVPANNTYGTGQDLDFTVNFDEAITVNTAGGTPQLSLIVGSATKQAVYQSGSGSSALIFRYTVQAGDEDTNGITFNGLSTNSGTLQDAAGNDANLVLNNIAPTSELKVDAVGPQITAVQISPSANATYTIGQPLSFSVTFDEDVEQVFVQLELVIGNSSELISLINTVSPKIFTGSYTIQSGDLDVDGISFGTNLILSNGSTARDASGNDANLTLNGVPNTAGILVDTAGPQIQSVTVPSDGSYGVGQNLDFTINFNENVTVNTTGGTPQLSLTVGSTTKQAVYQSGSGSSALIFRYTVQAGDTDSNGIAIGSLLANGGSLQDAVGNAATLTINNAASTANVNVDTTAPTVTSVTVPADGSYGAGQNLDFTINFDDIVTVNTTGGTPQLGLIVGSVTQQAVYQSGNGSSALIFRYTVQAGDTDADGIAIGGLSANGGSLQDATGNAATLTINNAASTANVNVDATAPTVTSVTVPADGSYGAGQNLDFTINFNEAVTVSTAGGTPQLSLTVGSTTKQAVYQSGSGSSALIFRYTVQAGDTDTNGIAIASLSANGGSLQDDAGNAVTLTLNNAASTANVEVDTKAPLPFIVFAPSNGSYALGQNLDFQIVFDDVITLNTAGGTPQLSLTVGSTTKQAVYQSGSGSSSLIFRYTVQAGDTDTDGIAIGSLSANGGTLQDAAGNDAILTFDNAAVASTANVNVDGVAPTVTSVTAPSDGSYGVGQNLDFTINFDDIVTVNTTGGTPQLGLTVGNTTKQAVYQSGSGSSALIFRYTVQAGDTDSNGIAIGSLSANGGTLQDDAGNDATLTLNNAASTANVNVDTTAPTVTSVTVPADGSYGAGQNLDFTINFNEAVTVSTAGGTPQLSLTVGSTTKQAVYQSGSGSSALIFRYTVQAGDTDADGIAIGGLSANGGTLQDAAGNAATLTLNNAASTANVNVDTTAPTVTSVTVPADGSYGAGQNLDFTINFNEAVTVSTAGGTPQLSLTVGSTTKQAVYQSGSGSSALIFRYTVQAGDTDADGIAIASLSANGGTLQDDAGNDATLSFTAPSTSNINIETVAPTIVSVLVPTGKAYRTGEVLTFNFAFSEDITVSGGTPSINLTIGGNVRQAQIQPVTVLFILQATYTIQAGDLDSDGIDISGISLNGAAIQDAAGNDAVLTFSSPSTTGITVDAVLPLIQNVTTPANGSYGIGQNLDFTVNFDESVLANLTSGTPQLSLTIGTVTKQANYHSGSGSNALVFRYTIQAGDSDADGITVGTLSVNGGSLRDAANNDANLSFTAPSAANVLVDTLVPSINSTAPADDASNATLSQNLTLTFDDNMAIGTGNITIVETGASVFEQLDVTNGALVSVSNNIVTLNPTNSLLSGKSYHVLVDATALDDDAGNSFAGISDPTVFNFSTVEVVINEVVTDPQQDWSSSNFASAPGGTAGADDEWVELFIKSPGIDLTGWTIELLDGTDVTGNLSSGGAFDVSNYTSSGSGLFTNTATGDYLILGNVSGSGLMNNTGLTINLKDPGGAIVDQVAIGGAANEAPSGNSSGVEAESVQRFANGSDTNADATDFTFGAASIASVNTGPGVTLSIDNATIAEAGGVATVTATRSGSSGAATTVTLGLKPNSVASENNDYTLSTTSIVIPAGANTTGTALITAIQDALDEDDEVLSVEVLGVANGTEIGAQEVTTTIIDDDAAPTIAFTSASSSAAESVSSSNIEVALSAISAKDVTVNYSVTGTATSADYTLANGSLTITAGNLNNSIAITSIVDDLLDENDETVIVSLSSPNNATLGTNTVHTFTITDNDPEPTVSLSVDNTNIAEAAGTATLTATLSAVSSKDVTVNLTYSGTATSGTDYNNTAATSILITAGNLSASASPIFTAVQDNTAESNETIIVDISNVINGVEDAVQQQTVTILDDDTPNVAFTTSASSGAESVANANLTVDLSLASTFSVTVDYTVSGSATNSTDYTLANGTLNFAPGSLTETIAISNIIDDAILEEDETIIVTLANPNNANLGANAVHTYTITNNDAAAVTIADVSGSEDGGAITVTATLDNAVQGGFTVDVSTVDGTATTADGDYTAIAAETLIFVGTAGEMQTFTVTPTTDNKPEVDETLNISQVSLAGTNTTVDITDNATVTVTNDDALEFSVDDPSVVEGNSGTSNLQYTVSLNSAAPMFVTIDYQTTPGAATSGIDYTAKVGTLTFAPGQTSQTVDVLVTGDQVLEANETVNLNLSNAAGFLANIVDNQGVGTITNDDAAAVTITPVSGAEDGGPITVTATLDNAVQGGFTVDVSTADGTATTADGDYTAITAQTLAFAGTAGETQTFTIAPTADTKLEADEPLSVSLVNLAATSLNVTTSTNIVTITNDDAAAVTIADVSGAENGGDITVTATLDNAVQGGFTVDVSTADGTATTADSDYTAVAGQTLTFTGTAGETQTFTITPIADTKLETDETLIISQGNLAATGLGVTITDGATITINNDDDATVTIADVIGVEDGGAITVTATLDNAVQGGFTVDVSTADGTATTADGDYTAITAQTLAFAGTAGETQTFTITPTADTKLEANETLTITQSNLSATTSNVNITDGATVTVINDDAAAVTIADVSGVENGGDITVTATLDNAVQGGFTVDVSTADGTATIADSDYTAITAQTITFAGTAGETQTFTITPTADTKLEADETLTITQNNLSATSANVNISDGATVTLTNDDAAAVTIANVSGVEDGGAITVTATLDNAVQGGFTVDVANSDSEATIADNDYTALTNEKLTFAGTAGETQTFTVIPTADTKLEADERLAVNLQNLAATSLNVNILSVGIVTITNDDAAAVTIAAVSGNENDGAITVTATLDNAVQGGFAVDVSTADGTATLADNDYTAITAQTLTFAGTAGETQTFTITPTGDSVPEGNETIQINQSNLSGTTLAVNVSGTGTVTILDDDVVQFSVDDPSVVEGNSGTSNLRYTVSLSEPASANVSVDITTSDGSASSGIDYTALSTTTLTFTPGQTSKTVDVIIIGDGVLESNEIVNLNLTNATGLSVIADAQGVGTITNDDAAAVTIADVSGAEDGGAITVTATLDNAVQGGFTVDVSTADGTATTADSDFTAITAQTLTFAGTAGETQTFTVTPTADTKLEVDETITISQANLSATTLSVDITDAANVTISNDDAIEFSVDDPSILEGNLGTSNLQYTVSLNSAAPVSVTIDYEALTGSATQLEDYGPQSGTLTFAPGQTSQTVDIVVAGDQILEENETVNLNLSNVSGFLATIIDAQGVGTITNDDAAAVTIADVSGAENGGNITVTATLDNAVQGGFTVDVSTADGTATTADSDYTAVAGQTLTFTGTAGETQTFTIAPTADTKLEANETLTITQGNLAATGLGVTITDGATVTINNDDAAAVTIADVSGAENGGNITVTATLDNAVQGGFTVDVSTADGTATTADSDYTAVAGQTLTFTGTAGETQTFTVAPTADTKLEANETLTISQGNLAATGLGVTITDGATVTINNDDNASVTIADVSGAEDGGAITVTATLDNAVQGGFTVDVSTADGTATTAGSDYIAVTNQTLTFTGTAGETQTFTVTPTADANAEANETILISQGNLSGTTLAVDITDGAAVTINDDDDGTAPSGYSVTFDDALIGSSETSASKFTFAGAEVGATYNYTVSSNGGGTNVTGTGTIATATDQITLADLSGLSDGSLTLSVTLTDPSSNIGTAVTASTSKDATAPSAPVVSSVTTDSGANGADGITSDNTPDANGTAEANATVEVFIDGSSAGTTTADGSGNWTLAYNGSSPVTDGTLSITAKATDAAGNTSSASSALSVTVDTAAPSAPVVSSISNDTGADGGDQNTNDATLSFNGTAEANAAVEVFIDAVSIGTTTADGSGNFSFDHTTTTLADASYSVTAKATDAAGNTSAASAALTVTVDTAAPAGPVIDLVAGSDLGISDTDDLTSDNTPTLSGTAEANATVEVFVDGTSVGTATADGSGNWTITPSSAIADGSITVTAKATDAAGNISAEGSLSLNIDTAIASPTLSPLDNAIDILPSQDLVLTFGEDINKGTGNITIKQSSDNTVLETIDVTSSKVSISGGVVTINPDNLILPPSTEFYVNIDAGAFKDNAGNDYAGISTTTDWSFTTIAASVVSSVAVPSADTYGIGDNIDFTVTMVLPVTITGTATIPLTIGTTTVNATQVGTVSNSSTITFRYTIVEGDLDTDGIAVGAAINLNGGTMKDAFDVDAILALNNVAATTAVLVDGVRPIPTITNANTTDPVNGVYTIFVEFDELVAGFSATDLTVSNGTSSNFTAISNDKKWSFDITPTADGTVSVSLAAGVANDNAGNASAAGAAVSKTFDGTAPEVSSITRKDADQLNTATTSADFRVIFSEDVLGVDLTDFELALTGTTGTLNTVTRVDAKTYDVNVNGISGQGTIGLNVKDDDSILDNAANQLGGTGLTNGDFTGEFYTTNFLPTDIISTPASISENNAVGDVVGALTSTDADAGDSHSYTLVSGTGDTDNASFSVDGTNLKAAAVFDFEAKDSYSIRMKTDDGKGGSFEKALTITIDNVLEPSIFVTGDATFDISALGLSQTRTLTVTNDGEKPVEVRVTSTPAGFSVLPGALVLVTGASADVTVTFVPTAVGNFGGDIIFSHEGGTEAHPVSGEGAIITSVDDGMIDPADITIYPNPASRLLTIDLSELNGSKLDITVVNATGTPMFNKEDHTDKELTLDVSGYQMGIYIVQFTNGQSIVRKKVMIKR